MASRTPNPAEVSTGIHVEAYFPDGDWEAVPEELEGMPVDKNDTGPGAVLCAHGQHNRGVVREPCAREDAHVAHVGSCCIHRCIDLEGLAAREGGGDLYKRDCFVSAAPPDGPFRVGVNSTADPPLAHLFVSKAMAVGHRRQWRDGRVRWIHNKECAPSASAGSGCRAIRASPAT